MANTLENVLLIVFGIALGQIPQWWARRRRLLSHWNFLKVEIDECGRIANGLVIKSGGKEAGQDSSFVVEEKKVVLSPLFRLPATSYATSFPALLAEETLAEDEIRPLVTFFGHVHEINRGLDDAAEMLNLGAGEKLRRERSRVSLKAGKIVQPRRNSGLSLFDECLRISTMRAEKVRRLTLVACLRYPNH